MAKSNTPFSKLVENTALVSPNSVKRAQQSVLRIEKVQVLKLFPTRARLFNAKVLSSNGITIYKTRIAFFRVPPNTVPSVSSSPCRVRCSCPMYYFYCWWWNKIHSAHLGLPMKKYVPVSTTRRRLEKNIQHLPCTCKHVIVLVEAMQLRQYLRN